MDKYIRNDDVNDDNGVYRGEKYPGLSLIHSKGTGEQPLHVIGSEAKSKELKKKEKVLSAQEKRLVRYVVEKGYSLRHAAKLMKIAQQTAHEYWKNIKEKMK